MNILKVNALLRPLLVVVSVWNVAVVILNLWFKDTSPEWGLAGMNAFAAGACWFAYRQSRLSERRYFVAKFNANPERQVQ